VRGCFLVDRKNRRSDPAFFGNQHVEGAAGGTAVHPFQHDAEILERRTQAFGDGDKLRTAAEQQDIHLIGGIGDGMQGFYANIANRDGGPQLRVLGENDDAALIKRARYLEPTVAIGLHQLAVGRHDGVHIHGHDFRRIA
jgi:hypothetical protein